MKRDLAVMVGMIGFYAMLIVVMVTAAARGRGLSDRRQGNGVAESFSSLSGSPPIDVLRVGDGAIVTVRSDIGEEAARHARGVVCGLIEDGVARMILEVDGSARPRSPLLGLLLEVAEASAVARTHFSLVTPDGEAAAMVRGSALDERIPIFLTHEQPAS
jgi:hypothetical protein